MRALIALGVLTILLAGCNGDSDQKGATGATTPTEGTAVTDRGVALHAAVEAYSDAYLTGEAETAFGMLSERCQLEIGKQPFTADVEAAGKTFGDPLPLKSFEGKFGTDSATVTYTYSIAAINQGDQPWVLEGGEWKYDDC